MPVVMDFWLWCGRVGLTGARLFSGLGQMRRIKIDDLDVVSLALKLALRLCVPWRVGLTSYSGEIHFGVIAEEGQRELHPAPSTSRDAHQQVV
jgi:hypothetical protein